MKKSVKGMMTGLLTMSMLVSAPTMVSAGMTAEYAGMPYAVEANAAKQQKQEKPTAAKATAAAQKAGKYEAVIDMTYTGV